MAKIYGTMSIHISISSLGLALSPLDDDATASVILFMIDAKFVAVRELQERGAIHLHVAVSGRYDIHWLRRAWWLALGHRVQIYYDDSGKKHLRALIKDGGEWVPARSDQVMGNIHVKAPSRRWGGKGIT
ncbi:MAG TPA: hypothetical protein DEP05_10055 [Betaproteobacteria bacterium]|nr:hypothetical protein [Betaproteobacteria bacterium]